MLEENVDVVIVGNVTVGIVTRPVDAMQCGGVELQRFWTRARMKTYKLVTTMLLLTKDKFLPISWKRSDSTM